MRRAGGCSVVLVAALGVAFVLSQRKTAAVGLAKARAFYAAQPRFLRPVPYSKTPVGIANSRAETCGVCHTEIYAEWKVSTHARAWLDDAQFQEELAKTRQEEGRDAGWICVNCHTPMEAQLPKLVTELKNGDNGLPVYVDNPNFDPKLQLEAITCGTCHIRDGVILGPYGDTLAPHPVRKAPELLRAEQCLECHQAKETFPDISLACVFDTGVEFGEGPYAKEGYTCQQCHMPEVERLISSMSTTPRKSRRHWFGGSLIAKHPKFAAELKPLEAHYPDGLAVRWVDLPESLTPGAEATLTFEATNAEAGHSLPTGDPERFILLRAEVRVADQAIATSEQRYGTTFDWDAMEKLTDTRLAPRESRRYTLTFTVPARGQVELSLSGSKWRLSQENFDYHQLEGRAVAGRPFLAEVTVLPIE